MRESARSRSAFDADGRGQPRPSIVCAIAVLSSPHSGLAALAGHFLSCGIAAIGPRECRARRRSQPRAGQASGSLSCLRRMSPTAIRSNAATSSPGEDSPRERGLARSGQSRARRGQGGRAPARHRGADARGDAGDRGLEPALRRASRALHDRDADVQLRHRDAEDHAR